ncbi:hypothetical protein [Cupriavidus sp. EM10]|uniref:hypothetical protein n=1 Tax=Cupriavidus sp. EM10 TaxID=2839983 RepID=UPI001BFFE773|nr:hypothetical protein [Cupriavidus sp. EM10]QWE94151.1 hypothetical protein KLP38_15095 [Cupriavidus sp. EM10]
MFTPNLDKGGKFKVGETWPLAYHQLRRTGGINMFASGLLSDSSIQVIMKHLTLLQTRYYGQNHSRVRFNEDFESLTVTARYEVMARQIEALVKERYVSPLGDGRKREIVVNLVGNKEFNVLVKAGRNGEVSFRETRLGGCTKNGHCDYGGIESIVRCTGATATSLAAKRYMTEQNSSPSSGSLQALNGELKWLSQTAPARAR